MTEREQQIRKFYASHTESDAAFLLSLLDAEREHLATCYRLTGADPDGNEDWRLAQEAVAEVRRLRDELNTIQVKSVNAIDIKAMRTNLHATFNGGYHDNPAVLKVFHHGMDTVCNVLEAWQKGETTGGVLDTTIKHVQGEWGVIRSDGDKGYVVAQGFKCSCGVIGCCRSY